MPASTEKPTHLRALRSLRRELGTPRAATAPSPSCALTAQHAACGGRGFFVGAHQATAHATLCSCVAECLACFGSCRSMQGGVSRPCRTPPPNRIVQLINDASIPARYVDASLEGFANFTGNGSAVVQVLHRWLQGFHQSHERGLLITGPVGVGKTYLLCALAHALALRGFSVRFVDFFQLLSQLRAAYSKNDSDLTYLQPLIDVDVLIIDELGKGRNSDWELTIIDQLIMGRYNQSRPIVASTNYPLQGKASVQGSYNIELDRQQMRSSGSSFYGTPPATEASAGSFQLDPASTLDVRLGARIFSRLVEMVVPVDLTGTDYRMTLAHRS